MDIDSIATHQWSLRKVGLLIVAALVAAAAAYAAQGTQHAGGPVQSLPGSSSATASPGGDEPVLLARRGRRR